MKLPFFAKPTAPSEDAPTSRRVEQLLESALAARATDLHFEPDEAGSGRLRLRVDGAFVEGARLEAGEHARVVARLKVLAGLPAFKTGEPLDGRLTHENADGARDLRLSTLPVVGGEKAVVRVLGSPDRPTRLAELGLSDAAQAALLELLEQPAGLVAVIGPCSSGKTTTLHAMARELLEREGDFTLVASVEDPVEQRVPGLSQCEVDPARGLDFPRALRALLRQDPDVLLVGETRDPETARMAVEAAFTGHRVFTSLHVGAPAEVPRRLELLGVPEYLVLDALRGAVSQRLFRRPCPDCAGEEPAACEACAGTGARGRFAVAEVVRFRDGAVRALTPPLAEAARAAREQGLTSAAELRRVLRAEGGTA